MLRPTPPPPPILLWPVPYHVTNLQDLQLALLRLGIGLSIRLQMKNNLHTLLWEEMQEEGKNTKW